MNDNIKEIRNQVVSMLFQNMEKCDAEDTLELVDSIITSYLTPVLSMEKLNEILKNLSDKKFIDVQEISDGYHTFKELYEFRAVLNAALFNEWGIDGLFDVHKSKRHHDGEECFGGEFFIVVANLPTGQITNHYPMCDWDLFKIPDAPTAKYKFDGHTSLDVLMRLKKLHEGIHIK